MEYHARVESKGVIGFFFFLTEGDFYLGFNNLENLFCQGVWIRISWILEQFLCRDGS